MERRYFIYKKLFGILFLLSLHGIPVFSQFYPQKFKLYQVQASFFGPYSLKNTRIYPGFKAGIEVPLAVYKRTSTFNLFQSKKKPFAIERFRMDEFQVTLALNIAAYDYKIRHKAVLYLNEVNTRYVLSNGLFIEITGGLALQKAFFYKNTTTSECIPTASPFDNTTFVVLAGGGLGWDFTQNDVLSLKIYVRPVFLLMNSVSIIDVGASWNLIHF